MRHERPTVPRGLAPLGLLAVLPWPRAQEAPAAGAPEGPPYRSLACEDGELPITLVRSQVLVDDVWVNGEGPFRFVLDTGGMGAGRVDASLVERLGLQPVGAVRAGDGTGRSGPTLPVYVLDSLQVGPLSVEGARVLSRDYNAGAAAVRGPVDGILGSALFDDLLLTIDYPGRRLRFEQGALPEPDGEEVLALDSSRGVPRVRLLLAGRELDAYIDSGAMGPLSLPESFSSWLPLAGEPTVVGQARTVSGAFDVRAATVDGDLVLGRHVSHAPRVVLGGPLKDAVLGGDALREYAVTLDHAHERVRFLRAGHPAPDGAPRRTTLELPETRVPLERVNGRPVIEARLGGRGPVRFVLDTGAPWALLNADLVRELGLPGEGSELVGAPGGEANVPAERHTLGLVEVGDARFEDVPARSWDPPGMREALGDVRGILGLPLFADLLVTLDGPAGELVLAHGALDEATSAPYELDGNGLPSFEIEVGGEVVRAHLDTGSPGGLTIPASLAERLPLDGEPRVVGRGRSASGEFEVRAARLVGSARVAGLELRDPELHLIDAFAQANVGSRILAAHALTFDQTHHLVRLGGGR